jgi:hypothetical protein
MQDKANGFTATDRKTDQGYAACAEAAEFLHGNVYSAMLGNEAAGGLVHVVVFDTQWYAVQEFDTRDDAMKCYSWYQKITYLE